MPAAFHRHNLEHSKGRHLILVLALAIALAIALGSAPASAQPPPYTFQTIAGVAPGSPFWFTHALTVDSSGTIYVYDSSHFVIRKVTPLGQVSTFAGGPDQSGTADGAGTNARFGLGYGIVVNSARNVYVADTFNQTIRKITPDGKVTTLAGLARASGYLDGAGSAARFEQPRGIAADSTGTVYVTDRSNTVRKITADGVVSTLAGVAGTSGYLDGVGSAALFGTAGALAVDLAGAVYVADGTTIRKVTPDGAVSTFAGQNNSTGTADGIGSAARFSGPGSLSFDGSGNLYKADSCRIRKVTSAAVVTTPAGLAGMCGQTDGPATTAMLSADAIGASFGGTVFFLQAVYQATALRAMAPDGTVTTVFAGGGGPDVADGTGQTARFAFPVGVAFDRGTIYVVDSMLLRTVTPTGVVNRRQLIDQTRGVAIDTAGIAYVTVGCGIQKVVPSGGAVTTLAGTVMSPLPGACGAVDGSGTVARFNSPSGIAVDAAGISYVADTGNHTIRRIAADGVVTTLAGSAGNPGSADGEGTAARFSNPAGIAVSSSGMVYVADGGNHTIRSITAAGVVSTVAGLAGIAGNVDGIGSAARFNQPAGLAIDRSEMLLVTEAGNSAIRMIAPSGEVTTIAGRTGYVGSVDGANDTALFSAPRGIAVDGTGTLYVADTDNYTIRVGLVGPPIGPAITTQPVSQTARNGQTVQFTVAATGRPLPGYQWQVSTNGGVSWTNLTNNNTYSGVAQPTLSLANLIGAFNGAQFRCVASSISGTATSDAATLTVNALALTPSSLRFAATKAGADGDLTAATPAQPATVSFTGPAPTWTVTANQPWIQITNGSGTGRGSFEIGIVNPSNVIGGSTSLVATVTVSDANLGLSATMSIALAVQLSGTGAVPFGVFDTPVNGVTGLQGSFAVTGWALDDVGIDRVEIWRDLVSGETTPPYYGPGQPGHGKVFVANALFVEGSRPDVARAYPMYPFVNRAGWGYLLLSQGLWAQGNGTYKLYAFAYDVEGLSTTLGTKTFTVSNATATKPFGALDTPTYGGTVSGTFWNYGWALTPMSTPTCVITNGNVLVGIDSGPLVPVDYGQLRTDIAAAFPGVSNGNNSGGSFLIDTTTLSDGMHQIGWLVSDDCGRQDGIGSRFFTVRNASGARPDDHPGDIRPRSAGRASRPAAVGRDPIAVRHLGGEWTTVSPTVDGWHVIEVPQDGRIEVQLPRSGGGRYTDHQDATNESQPLPLGSSLDSQAGIFYWQPAAGFLGKYDLVFESAGAGAIRVRVVVGPPMRAVIDAPRAESVVAQPFTLAGWALDLAAHEGTGVDTVHVWAYPSTGAEPIFVGIAAYGDTRPDVGAMFGEGFAGAAYGLTVDMLPPGTYDIVMYPHRAKTNTFEGAQIVRVTAR